MPNYTPTLAGFLAFIRQVMGIKSKDLPDSEPSIAMSFAVAMELVNLAIQQASPLMYQQAVYNLAGDTLINFAPDQQGCKYFQKIRKSLHLNQFTAGVIASSNDEGTGQSMDVIEAAKNFTVANLQSLKTLYGRTYIGIAQAYGPTIWGVT